MTSSRMIKIIETLWAIKQELKMSEYENVDDLSKYNYAGAALNMENAVAYIEREIERRDS